MADQSEKDDTHTSKSDKTKDESGDEAEPTIAQDIVVTKYNMAAEIVNSILKELVAKCQVGQSVGEMCDYGDQQLAERANKVVFSFSFYFVKIYGISFSGFPKRKRNEEGRRVSDVHFDQQLRMPFFAASIRGRRQIGRR